jgi:very-long-chain (3R)-3-hydroxyacyl-CoA dehydratase
MQVASRFLLVWGVVYPCPEVAGYWPYSTMLLAWSTTEVIRYTYFAIMLGGSVLAPLFWLRYNTFFVLYPIGIASELAEIFFAVTGPASRVSSWYPWALIGVSLLYIPGEFPIPLSCCLDQAVIKKLRELLGISYSS